MSSSADATASQHPTLHRTGQRSDPTKLPSTLAPPGTPGRHPSHRGRSSPSMPVVAIISLLLLATISACDTAPPPQQPATATLSALSDSIAAASPAVTPACPTLAQATYFLTLAEIQSGMVNAFADLGETFALAGEQPLLVFDDDWRLNVAITLTTMNIAAEQIIKLSPPAGLDQLHSLQLQVADQLEIITSSSIQGIDNVDATLLDEATTAIARTNTLVERSAEIIEYVCG
jgi:hypothetical protein